ncbi:MAG: Gfo/Idh/MocA family oxidoreductase [Clostridia bacterium]|nr:Gfo/Idh/MocA family oxidoreductase [Clostridia bacterium]
MFKIGTVNIDTSHAPSFAEILLKGDEGRYTAIYNDGFRTDDEVNTFIERFGLEKRYTDLSEMAKNIDIAFIQSCNWDDHVKQAMPFIEANVPVFIDKPIAGNLADLKTFEQLDKEGKVILGTSAMRYTYEHESFFAIPEEERGNIIHISVMVGVDEFNYAIHAVESIMGFIGDITPISTRFIGTSTVGDVPCDSYYIVFENGATACYHICKKGWQPSTALVMTSKTSFAYKIDSNKVYEAMLKQVCAYMAGKENKLATVKQMTDSVKIMLAGIKSAANDGKTELISELTEADPSFDGKAFEEFYAASQRK